MINNKPKGAEVAMPIYKIVVQIFIASSDVAIMQNAEAKQYTVIKAV
ncbi:hypothetical protein GCM10017717_01420 [Deinococcus persicinus]